MACKKEKSVIIKGDGLTIDELVSVARYHTPVKLTDNKMIWKRVDDSYKYIQESAETGKPVYGVTTGFGGMANVVISPIDAMDLQNNLLRFVKTGAGKFLPREDVRAAMLLRTNSHLKGVSGLRRELLRRIETFLNHNVTPNVREYGSIGASGDLAPLGSICGALIGLDKSYTVDFNGEQLDSITALKKLGLETLKLQPKEGLAMINGTSVMTGMAANCIYDGQNLLGLGMAANSLIFQGLRATNQSFHPFIHRLKPHYGQIWCATQMIHLLEGSTFIRDELDGHHDYQNEQLIQDRYSLRCMPQYMGPIVDGIKNVAKHVTTEMNCANDNPLIDPEVGVSYHAGNFLGQYIGVYMDHFRYYLGLLAKHLDVQIALLVAPEFNNGLTPSLVGNPDRKVNMGLKGLQICGNSIMPLITHMGNSLADRFPTHAEQFNQNVNSMGFGSAWLSRNSIDPCQKHMAISLIFGTQAVDLRSKKQLGHYDARAGLSTRTIPLYEAVYKLTGNKPSQNKPLIWNDDEQPLDLFIEKIATDIAEEGLCIQAIQPILEELR